MNGYFCPKVNIMTPQDILYPLGEVLESSFEIGLLPVTDIFNLVAIAGGIIGLASWVRMQLKFTAQAKRDGTIN
ncbi:MAG: hypothetical protein ACJAU0_000476 [Flavobacteriales bacterium]